AGVRRQTGAAMILISHDLGVVAGVADRVMVMYAGQAVESGPVDEVFAAPRMPYTAGLLASLPSLSERRDRLAAIGGAPPAGTGYGAGCAFAPRCPAVSEICGTQPGLADVGPGHLAACHFAGGNGAGPGPVAVTLTWGERRPAASAGASPSRTAPALTAADPGPPAAPAGRAQLRHDHAERPGADRPEGGPAAQRPPDIQMVFQDPYSALNPRLSVGEIIGEPLTVHRVADRAKRTRELLASV